jgi:hypothetical protein
MFTNLSYLKLSCLQSSSAFGFDMFVGLMPSARFMGLTCFQYLQYLGLEILDLAKCQAQIP